MYIRLLTGNSLASLTRNYYGSPKNYKELPLNYSKLLKKNREQPINDSKLPIK